MKWLRSLYVGEKIAKDKAAVIRLIEKPTLKSRFLFCCLISPALQPEENLEVLPLIMLNEKHFDRSDRVILGIAGGMKEAEGLLLRMTQDCLDAGGGVRVKEYFLGLPDSAFSDRGEVVSRV